MNSITVKQAREIDKIMVGEMSIPVIVMMENAARNVAVLAKKMLNGSVKRKKISVLSGKGNNGGDGLGAARHLINYGANVSVILTSKPEELGEHALAQYNILKNMNARIYTWSESNSKKLTQDLRNADLLIDALLGFNLKGNPRDPIAALIKTANDSKTKILAVDIPSGLDGDTGKPLAPTIEAHTTLTLALPKVGILTDTAREYTGELYVGDISVPNKVYERLGINTPLIFEHEDIVRIF